MRNRGVEVAVEPPATLSADMLRLLRARLDGDCQDGAPPAGGLGSPGATALALEASCGCGGGGAAAGVTSGAPSVASLAAAMMREFAAVHPRSPRDGAGAANSALLRWSTLALQRMQSGAQLEVALHDAAAIALIAVPRAALRALARRCALGGTADGGAGPGGVTSGPLAEAAAALQLRMAAAHVVWPAAPSTVGFATDALATTVRCQAALLIELADLTVRMAAAAAAAAASSASASASAAAVVAMREVGSPTRVRVRHTETYGRGRRWP